MILHGLAPTGEFSKAEAASIEILIHLFSEVLDKYYLKLPKWFCYVTSGLILRPFPWSTDQFWEFNSTCVKCEIIARHPSSKGRVIERFGNYFINIALFLKTLRMNCWAFQGKLKFRKGLNLRHCSNYLKYLLCNVDIPKNGDALPEQGCSWASGRGGNQGPHHLPSASPLPLLPVYLLSFTSLTGALFSLLAVSVVRWNTATNSSQHWCLSAASSGRCLTA